MMPVRIQRKRAKGWKMPPNTVYVGRGSKFGNPFPVIEGWVGVYPDFICGRKLAVRRFGEWLKGKKFKRLTPETNRFKAMTEIPPTIMQIKEALKGKNLACWCKPNQECHADILLELANAES